MYNRKHNSPTHALSLILGLALIFFASFAAPAVAAFAADSCDDHCEDACETCCDCIQCVPSLYMVSSDNIGSGEVHGDISWWLHSASVHPDGALTRGIDRPPQLSL